MKRLCLKIVTLCGLLVIPSGLAIQDHKHEELPDFDRRSPAGLQGPAGKAAAAARLHRSLPSSRVEFNKVTGSPHFITAGDGFLTGRNGRGLPDNALAAFPADDPDRVTKAFINEHREIFGHGPELLLEAEVKREFVGKHNGLRTVVWQQQFEGIPVFQGLLISHTTKNAELVTLSSRFVSRPGRAAEASLKKGLLAATPISAKRAVVLAAREVEEEIDETDLDQSDDSTGSIRKQKFKADQLLGETSTQLVWLPVAEEELRLCWQVILTSRERGEMYRLLIDAETGDAVVRHSLTRYASEASYRVFVGDSPTPFSPGHPFPTNTQPPLVSRQLVTITALSSNASPDGWITDAYQTFGNNVEARRPGHSYPQATNGVFDFSIDLNSSPFNYTSASVANLFYWCNWMHDRLYDLGFTEAAGNFQTDNFERGGVAGDPVLVDAQYVLNRATMQVPPDGTSPTMQIGIFTGPTPDRDAALDVEVVLHEYTHGLSDRLVGGGEGMTALQSRALAEGWSDFYALALLSEPSDDPAGVYPFAGYSTYHDISMPSFEENYYFGVRRYPYSTDMAKNPLTFKDTDPSQADPHAGVPQTPLQITSTIHKNGEVWCSALWDARASLIQKHGFSAGNELILQLVTDGMILTPAEPNFIHARDALLQADLINNGGSNHRELWAAFAKRGLGFFASSPASSTNSPVVESFALPDQLSISPVVAFVSSGPDQGPFWPLQQSYTLTNVSTNTVTWGLAKTSAWLNVSATSGTLLPTAATNLVFSLNLGVAYTLTSGVYTEDVSFTNEYSGLVQTRRFTLRVGQVDYLTENFEAAEFDLQNQTLTFTPNGSPGFYSVCRQTATNFPTLPAGGNPVVFTNGNGVFAPSDDGFVPVTLSSNVSFYGRSTNRFFIGSNGYLTFDGGDTAFSPSFNTHMNQPRISAFFRDLDLTYRGAVSWKELGDRAAVTFVGVPQRGTARTNSFQVELFFDGRIAITWLEMNSKIGLVGLSRGEGVPAEFVESDLGGYSQCVPPITIDVPGVASEGAGTLTGAGSVTLPLPLATNLTVSLYSTDDSEVTVPASVVVLAGQTTAIFDVTVIDDSDLDGTRAALVVAQADGFESARAEIAVHDNESAVLAVTLPATATEGEGSKLGSVSVSAVPTSHILVSLMSDNTNEVSVPTTVTITAGQTSAVFTATIIDDSRIDGAQTASVTASVENWIDGQSAITVLDNESTNLTLLLPPSVREGNGMLPAAGVVTISGTLSSNLMISLNSSDTTAATVPVSATIPAGSTSAAFDITAIDDTDLDGSQTTEVTASAAGFSSNTIILEVTDDESPLAPLSPTPAHLDNNVPITTDLAWSRGFEEGQEQLANGDFETGTLANWISQSHSNGTISFNNLNAAVTPFAGSYHLLINQTAVGTQSIYQDVTIPNVQVATLAWADQIVNQAGAFSENQQFRCELRNTNNAVLEVLLETQPGFTAASGWTTRGFDLSLYRGQRVRIAFVLEGSEQPIEVHLDAVSLRAGNPPLTTYDVYFGTNDPLTAADLLGSTTNTFWDLPMLDPLVTYYWQVIARRTGESSGPVWQFSTVPEVSIADASVTEGDENSVTVDFTLSLSAPSSQSVTVYFSTADGTAIEPADYVGQENMVTFGPGETTQMLTVTINPDTIYELDETFTVNLTSAENASIADGTGTCTILNDDPFLAAIADMTVNEGELVTFTAQAGIVGPAETVMIANFEDFTGTVANDTVMFRKPRHSGPTSGFLATTPDISVVTNVFPAGNSSSRVLHSSWSFTSNTNAWVRLTTAATPYLPNPTVDFNQVVRFNVFTDRPLKLGMGLRETGTTNAIGSDGGTTGTIEHAGVTNKTAIVGTPWPVRTLATGIWQTVSFNLPQEPVTPLSGDGTLYSGAGASNKGVLEHLSFVPANPNEGAGIHRIYLDDFEVVYSNALSFALENAPAGATIHPQTGVFSWTPTEAHGPGTYTITVNVTENTASARTGTQTFTVTVNEANSQPTFPFITDKSVSELAPLTFAITATDTDIPANVLTYALDSNAPEGAAIDENGVFTWTPAEAQGPGVYPITISVEDDGAPALTFSRTFWVTVTETNSPPTLQAVPDKAAYADNPISFSIVATDPDVPADSLTFSFASAPPTGATIDANSGLFTWQPGSGDVSSTNVISIRVTDNGSPALSDTTTFQIVVLASPKVETVTVSGSQLTLSWPAIAGSTYRVQYKTQLTDAEWQNLEGDIVAEGSVATKTDTLVPGGQRFYRLVVVE